MAGFLSIFRGGYKALFASLTSARSTFRNWFRREVRPALQGIISAINRLYSIHVRPFASPVVQFIYNHPLLIALGLLSIIVIIWPGIVTAPFLALLGFMVLGPVAGSIASLTQSIFGNVAAGSVFAALQSAGMAGYGLVIINGVVIGIAVLVLAMVIIQFYC
ncbi:hypothetical protein BcDW1_3554 [Botrytis cinerea BcDW1]|uniref:Uncharacterized protein n=1 Tax=Botryotinia fuckeliana (strain BcDW1) TaxID=1290391 RepID=M7U2I5_BOTF1|nr:hypothetical protein BcDW1_3554 [Botrytis cinerea BcDW1]